MKAIMVLFNYLEWYKIVSFFHLNDVRRLTPVTSVVCIPERRKEKDLVSQNNETPRSSSPTPDAKLILAAVVSRGSNWGKSREAELGTQL